MSNFVKPVSKLHAVFALESKRLYLRCWNQEQEWWCSELTEFSLDHQLIARAEQLIDLSLSKEEPMTFFDVWGKGARGDDENAPFFYELLIKVD